MPPLCTSTITIKKNEEKRKKKVKPASITYIDIVHKGLLERRLWWCNCLQARLANLHE